MITDKSGKAGISLLDQYQPRTQGRRRLDKRHPGVAMINKAIMKSYEEGRVTSISHAEMDKLVRKYLPELFMSDLEKIKYMASKTAVSVLEQVIDRPP